MAELEEKLNAILSDPQAMEQILSAARALSGQETAGTAPPEGAETGRASAPSGDDAGQGAPDGLFAALGDLDPRWVKLGARLIGEYSRRDDKKAALLEALKPFLKPERQAKVDQAAKIARLSRVAKAALRLYREEQEEGGHV